MTESEPEKRPLFALGQVVATPGALEALDQAGLGALTFLTRHVTGDWGDLDDEDKQLNDQALTGEDRIFSAYILPTGQKVWVITEWDRSATTFLLPDEY